MYSIGDMRVGGAKRGHKYSRAYKPCQAGDMWRGMWRVRCGLSGGMCCVRLLIWRAMCGMSGASSDIVSDNISIISICCMSNDWKGVGKGCKRRVCTASGCVRVCLPPPMLKKGKREGVRDVLTVGNRNRTGYGGKLRACSKRLGFQIFPPK